MSRPRFRVDLRSIQGFHLRYISRAEALALFAEGRLHQLADGVAQLKQYEKDREGSPTSITAFDMRAVAGLAGGIKPVELRRDGEIDPVEAAIQKVEVWPEIGDVKREISGCYCPWPRVAATPFTTVSDRDVPREIVASKDVKDFWRLKMGIPSC